MLSLRRSSLVAGVGSDFTAFEASQNSPNAFEAFGGSHDGERATDSLVLETSSSHERSAHDIIDLVRHLYCFQSKDRTLSFCHIPITAPVSPTHSLTLFTAAFAMPVFLRLCPFTPTPALSPVAYSEPMLGSTFSPALRLTKKANGTNQTQIPK